MDATMDATMQALEDQVGVGLDFARFANIRVMRDLSFTPLSERIFLMNLKTTNQGIALAIDGIDYDVLGYRSVSSDSNEDEFWYFNDVPRTLVSVAVRSCTQFNPLPFRGSYVDLERVAGQSRKEIPLGNLPLRQSISTLSTTKDPKSVAKSLIVLTQMLPETFRYRYIHCKVLYAQSTIFYPDPLMISYEQNWLALSRAVQAGHGNTLNPPVRLLNAEGQPFTVTLVSQIMDDLWMMWFVAPEESMVISDF